MTDGSTDADDPEGPAPVALDLYGLRPEEFIEARNHLVKRLRASGRREEASEAARMRKPPATAWALNQVARQRPELVVAVFEAGGRLRAAMAAALAGDASGVRPARAAEREAVAAALLAAGRHLEEAGHAATDAARRRIEATLRAAMVDDSVALGLTEGVLDGDHDPPGFGFEDSAPAVEREVAKPDKAARQEAERQAAAERARLIDQGERLARRAEELEAIAHVAESAARAARGAADAARVEANDARLAVEEAERPAD